MFRGSSSRSAFSQPRGPSQVDLTLSSDDEDSPVKPPKSSKPRPPVLDSDSDEGDSDVEVVPTYPERLPTAGSRGQADDASENANRVSGPRALTSKGNERDLSESDDSSSEETDENSPEQSVVISEGRPSPPSAAPPKATSMADALAALSFKKKPSPTPPSGSGGTTEAGRLDSDQASALRKQGFLPASSNPPPKATDPRAFYAPRPTGGNPHAFRPTYAATFRTGQRPGQSHPTTFASSLNAFNLKPQPISVKERLGAQLTEENKARGIPIAVPSNPPMSIVRREGKVAATKGGTRGAQRL